MSKRDLFEDITGQEFHNWTVRRRTNKTISLRTKLWECICRCGNIGYVDKTSLQQGKSKSCGCLRSVLSSNKSKRERIWGKK